MSHVISRWFIALLTCAWLSPVWASTTVRHELTVTLDPATHRIEAVDKITFPSASTAWQFDLHGDLKLQPEPNAASVKQIKSSPAQTGGVPLNRYEVILPAGAREITLRYIGEIFHPLEEATAEYARSFHDSPGIISPEGIYLAHPSAWYPLFANTDRVTFKLQVTLPEQWSAVSQGKRLAKEISNHQSRVTWEENSSQEEIYLIASTFSEYSKTTGAVEALVFLREPDAALAQKYLDVTAQYIEMYRQLIGPYPYTKFALVENFWETGYGMPSFTLLGSKVIRLPFILYSSYPHEILHNWWGNSVYVDIQQGNWSEGLTSYLADHLIQEQQGNGASARRALLQNYADFVSASKDFPLSEFRMRHSSSSEAVGYGKAQMLFHMLRLELGDQAFIKGLHQFYMQYRFKEASFADLATLFGRVAGRDLTPFFEQWVKRVGAPALQIKASKVEQKAGQWSLTFTLTQSQVG
ncbi:MAG: peptidase M28, partial [Halothiobacillaceae bacterium]